MKKIYLTIIGLTIASFLQAQNWTAIHAYNTQSLVWDKPMVDVSSDDVILVSFETKNPGNPLLISKDNGQTWDTIMHSYQREFIGFDSQKNLYIAKAAKTPNVSITHSDSLFYSTDLGVTLQNIGDLPDNGYDKSSYYIDPNDNLYTLSSTPSANLINQFQLYKNGQATTTMLMPFSAGSSSLRGIIQLSNGNHVVSSYNNGIYWTADGGATWNESQNDAVIGTSTFTDFEEANNGNLFLAGVSLKVCTDGGETWASSNLNENFVFKIIKAGNGSLYAISQFFGVHESLDHGSTWAEITNLPPSYKDIAASDNYLYLIANDTLWRTAVSNGVGLLEKSIQNNTLKVFPNPSASEINIVNSNFNGNPWEIIITDQLGREIFKTVCYTETYTINRNKISEGMYIVSMFNEKSEFIHQTRFIKLK